jgi:hypothetical protein
MDPASPRRILVPIALPSRVVHAPPALRLWHLASLDAPTVAVVWALGFAWAAGVRLPLWVPLLLALTAWAVYIGDRLLDARAGLHEAALHRLRERHLFHWRHRRIFIPLAAAAACAAAWIVLVLMPAGARERDSVLGAAALIYFTRVHSSRNLPLFRSRFLSPLLTKELLVGVLFTAGCALPAWYRTRASGPGEMAWPVAVPVLFFALLAWLNCHSIERWESLKCRAPRPRILTPATALALAGALLAVLLAAAQPRSAALIAAGAVSALLLALLDRLRHRFTPVALRAAADLVLLTPLLLAPFAFAPFPLLLR